MITAADTTVLVASGPRERILPDFLVGAHAVLSTDAFLTRDRRFYGTYFPELRNA